MILYVISIYSVLYNIEIVVLCTRITPSVFFLDSTWLVEVLMFLWIYVQANYFA